MNHIPKLALEGEEVILVRKVLALQADWPPSSVSKTHGEVERELENWLYPSPIHNNNKENSFLSKWVSIVDQEVLVARKTVSYLDLVLSEKQCQAKTIQGN